jgi:6-phosphofructokinase
LVRLAHQEGLGWDTRVSVMAHLMRGGQPTLEDRILGARMGVAAADFAHEENFGVMVALRGGGIIPFPLEKLPMTTANQYARCARGMDQVRRYSDEVIQANSFQRSACNGQLLTAEG